MANSLPRVPETTFPRNETLLFLRELIKTLGQQTDFHEIVRLVCSKAMDLTGADIASTVMINPRTRQTIKTVYGNAGDAVDSKYRSVQDQITGWVLKYDDSLISHDLAKDKRFHNVVFGDPRVLAAAGVPLKMENVLIGALVLLVDEPERTFDAEGLESLETFAGIVAPYLRNVHELSQYFLSPLPDAALLAKFEKVGLYGKSERFKELLRAIVAAAKCDIRVLLEGQTGSGKELAAKAIHIFSSRSENPFVAIDCGAIPENLIESELFGHIRGAFTGANHSRKGLFEEANGGTLFMDEIGNLPLQMQVKLMRVLQENEIRPLGTNQSKKVDVRVISATSKPLKVLIKSGDFRQDLYFRLHVYPISIPSLDERKQDIPMLAHQLLEKIAAATGKEVTGFHESILEFMNDKDWPGNVRELEHYIERLVAFSPPNVKTIGLRMLPADMQAEIRVGRIEPGEQEGLAERLRNYESEIIYRTLDECNWNQSKAARKLRISERNIRFRMEKLGIRKPS